MSLNIVKSFLGICYLLEKVRNPSKCSVEIGQFISAIRLTSVGAVRLASLLPRFNNVIALQLSLRYCCAAALDTLVTSITYKTLQELTLHGIILTPAATKELGRSLPEMSSLVTFELSGVHGSILQAEQMEALFGRLDKTVPLLQRLTLGIFNARGCLAPLIKSLRFFPNLRGLLLIRLNIDEHDLCSLLKSFGSLKVLKVGIDSKGHLGPIGCYPYPDVKLDWVEINQTVVAAVVGRLLSELSSLKHLKLTGWGHRNLTDEGHSSSILQAEEMEALFGGFNKTVHLYRLTFTDVSIRYFLFPLFSSFCFPNLVWLDLNRLRIDEDDDLHGLLESFQFIPNLKVLNLTDNFLGLVQTSIVPHIINLKKLQYLSMSDTYCSEEGLNYLRDIVQEALPDLKIVTNSRFVGIKLLDLL